MQHAPNLEKIAGEKITGEKIATFDPTPTSTAGSSTRTALDLAIIIVSYNTRALLRDCLHSVQASEGNFRYRLCVVDNASHDGSVEMVRSEFPHVHLIESRRNVGYPAANNIGLRWFGFHEADEDAGDRESARTHDTLPRYALLLNPDTVLPTDALMRMLAFMDEHPNIGVAGPCLRLLDGSLDKACRRSFPTPHVSLYRTLGLSKLFPRSRVFNAYNLGYLAEDAVCPVDSVVGAYMQIRREAILQTGLLDETFFMYGEDLDWAKRIKDAGWEVWYNGAVEVTHVKEAASSQSSKSRIDFYEAMWIFYRKHYRQDTPRWLEWVIRTGIAMKAGLDMARHLWRFCR